jgi:hypothetical protein
MGVGFENLKNVYLKKISNHEKSTFKFCLG